MKRRDLLKQIAVTLPALTMGSRLSAAQELINEPSLPIAPGPFKPNWKSLSAYKTPEWFRNAKFGIWAHWGPQCEPEHGDWYAREMYMEGSRHYLYHLKKYGHPSQFGFKDVINVWKADQWNPDQLLSLYKQAGARYFMALANHHDNLDLYKSRYQPEWNATKIGPRKDLIAGWKKAARTHGLYFGVSVHAAHTWSWLETAQRWDTQGEYKGIPYDGNLSKADGKDKWWQGLDPQDLYAQNHALSRNSWNNGEISKQWDWGNGVSVPSKAYFEKFYNRTIDLIDSYQPDLIYFDDTALPLWPVSDVGLKIAAHTYNQSMQKNGKVETVILGKILNELQRRCMVWDIERGQSNSIEPLPWQTDTCIGSWHYDRDVYLQKRYKSAKTVIHTLADVVSKNGNLLLSVPVRGNGTIDEIEEGIVAEIGQWMAANSEAIYDTRPWKVFGEGPAIETAAPLSDQGFNEGKNKPFTAADIRFTRKDNVLYAIILGWPGQEGIRMKSMGTTAGLLDKAISKVTLLSNQQSLDFKQHADALEISLGNHQPALSYAIALKIV